MLVEWTIDIEDEDDFLTAALRAFSLIRSADTSATVFRVTDPRTGATRTVDLGEDGDPLRCEGCGEKAPPGTYDGDRCEHPDCSGKYRPAGEEPPN